MTELHTLSELIQSGGNVALLVVCYFLYKAEQRLSRIEKVLEVAMMALGHYAPPPATTGRGTTKKHV